MLAQVTYNKVRAGCAGNELAGDAVGIGIVPPGYEVRKNICSEVLNMPRKTYEKTTLTDDESIDDKSNQPDMNDEGN